LALSLGTMVSTWTAASLEEALDRCRVKDVARWCRATLGDSVQSQRRRAYGPLRRAINPGGTATRVNRHFSSAQGEAGLMKSWRCPALALIPDLFLGGRTFLSALQRFTIGLHTTIKTGCREHAFSPRGRRWPERPDEGGIPEPRRSKPPSSAP